MYGTLVAAGHTNRQIAAALVIAEPTAERHVANILNKMEFHSRAQTGAMHGRAATRHPEQDYKTDEDGRNRPDITTDGEHMNHSLYEAGIYQAAREAGLHSGATVADLVARFNRHGLAGVRIARGRGRRRMHPVPARR
jgi:Bacterial regulatory proteins, luxR family